MVGVHDIVSAAVRANERDPQGGGMSRGAWGGVLAGGVLVVGLAWWISSLTGEVDALRRRVAVLEAAPPPVAAAPLAARRTPVARPQRGAPRAPIAAPNAAAATPSPARTVPPRPHPAAKVAAAGSKEPPAGNFDDNAAQFVEYRAAEISGALHRMVADGEMDEDVRAEVFDLLVAELDEVWGLKGDLREGATPSGEAKATYEEISTAYQGALTDLLGGEGAALVRERSGPVGKR